MSCLVPVMRPVAWGYNEGGRYLMVTDKPLRPRSCAGLVLVSQEEAVCVLVIWCCPIPK